MTRTEFLTNPSAYGSHRTVLWEALEATKDLKLPVVELGSGPASTPFLKQYCADNALEFLSYDSSPAWASVMKSVFVANWDEQKLWEKKYGVCLLDMAPGEYRRIALKKIKAEIVVIHDSEPAGWNASDYRVRELFPIFKFKFDDIPSHKGSP